MEARDGLFTPEQNWADQGQKQYLFTTKWPGAMKAKQNTVQTIQVDLSFQHNKQLWALTELRLDVPLPHNVFFLSFFPPLDYIYGVHAKVGETAHVQFFMHMYT